MRTSPPHRVSPEFVRLYWKSDPLKEVRCIIAGSQETNMEILVGKT
jgi:hypothetical protein